MENTDAAFKDLVIRPRYRHIAGVQRDTTRADLIHGLEVSRVGEIGRIPHADAPPMP